MTFETDDALRKLETVEAECERYKKACELKVIFSFIIIRFAQMIYFYKDGEILRFKQSLHEYNQSLGEIKK